MAVLPVFSLLSPPYPNMCCFLSSAGYCDALSSLKSGDACYPVQLLHLVHVQGQGEISPESRVTGYTVHLPGNQAESAQIRQTQPAENVLKKLSRENLHIWQLQAKLLSNLSTHAPLTHTTGHAQVYICLIT